MTLLLLLRALPISASNIFELYQMYGKGSSLEKSGNLSSSTRPISG